jgi:riboflavin kinase/FMN adenylyltransferase
VRLLRSLDNLPADLRRGAVTIGNFDGVHRGHALIVERLLAKASEVGGPAIVFTFDPHPVRILRPEAAPPPLTWTDRKAQLLAELGVTAVISYPTDEALLALSPQEFFALVVRQRLEARAMVEGPNFFFGRGRSGNIDVLRQLCQAAGVSLEIVQPLVVGSEYVSSSRVRSAVQAGDVDLARQLLTRPYRIRGMVTHGAGRGAKIGFPTANVAAVDTLLPGQGVYAGRGTSQRGTWPAAVNIGPNPTFGESALKVEVHLIGFAGSLYGQPLEVDFLARLRSIQPFASVEQLKQQLARDVAAARRIAEHKSANEEGAVG